MTAVGPVAGATGVVVNTNVTGDVLGSHAAVDAHCRDGDAGAAGQHDAGRRRGDLRGDDQDGDADPTADLATSTMYTATIKGGGSGAKDLAGNPLAADKVWTFTTGASGATVTYLSDRTWTSMTNGWGPVEKDRSNGEAGASDGGPITLNGVGYVKGLGAHAASDVRYALNGTCSVLTAVVGIDDEVGNWGGVVFQVWTDGVKRYDSGLMTGAMPGMSISVGLTGASELRLIVTDGGDGNGGDHGDWADAKVTCSTDATRADGDGHHPGRLAQPGQCVSTNVTATFSEAMNAATLTTATVTARAAGERDAGGGDGHLRRGHQHRDARPDGRISPPNTMYTATIKGGASGAKDVAGNQLAADKVWSFTTDAPPVPVISQPSATLKFKVGDPITYAGSATDPEDGTLSGTNLSWSIVLQHCPGGHLPCSSLYERHRHDRIFTAPDHGDEFYFEINLTATDSAGLSRTVSVNIQAQTVQLTLETSPTGLQVSLRWLERRRARDVTDHRRIGPHDLRAVTARQRGFPSWSDGGAQMHNVLVAATDATYVATFNVPDTTPPTVTLVSPASGATGVGTAMNVRGTFSEAMNSSTMTTATVTLAPQGGSPLAAAVTYDGETRTVTIDPTSDLDEGRVYTATIKGGASGVKDVAGNALAADRVWTFTTAATADTTPPTVTATAPANGPPA